MKSIRDFTVDLGAAAVLAVGITLSVCGVAALVWLVVASVLWLVSR